MREKIEMTFTCDQDWYEMEVSSRGRHCEMCKKNVHDFTDKTIAKITRTDTELCGLFRAEQIEPDLIPIEIPFSLRHTLFTIGAVLGLEMTQAHGQDLNQKPKVENVMKDSVDVSGVPAVDSRRDEMATNQQECKEVKRPIRRKYYFSKRFPFIAKRRVRVMGRFRH